MTTKIAVLCYHSVKNWDYPHSIPIEIFKWQMEYLRENFQVLSLDDTLDVIGGRLTLQRMGVLVTFDDGLEDNLTNAYPILKELDIPAVVFLATNYVDVIHAGPLGYPFKFLSWEQACLLISDTLVTIQSHTDTHPLLSTLESGEIRKEFSVANQKIESYLGYKPVGVAYPKSAFNESVLNVAAEFYECGFGGDGIFDMSVQYDKMTIPRILITQNISRTKFKSLFTNWYWRIKR